MRNRRQGMRRVAGIAAVVLALLVVPLAVVGYRIMTVEGVVTVEEAIQVDPETFAVSLYPGESHTETVTVSNLSSSNLAVSLTTTSTPGIITSVPTGMAVPGKGSVTFNIVVAANAGAAPGIYEVHIATAR
jgi:uncharacterized membrane protein